LGFPARTPCRKPAPVPHPVIPRKILCSTPGLFLCSRFGRNPPFDRMNPPVEPVMAREFAPSFSLSSRGRSFVVPCAYFLLGGRSPLVFNLFNYVAGALPPSFMCPFHKRHCFPPLSFQGCPPPRKPHSYYFSTSYPLLLFDDSTFFR